MKEAPFTELHVHTSKCLAVKPLYTVGHHDNIKDQFDMKPEVYYLHEVCRSCTNLVHSIVLQEQLIWPIRDVLFHKLTRKVSKRSNAVWETYLACERTVSLART